MDEWVGPRWRSGWFRGEEMGGVEKRRTCKKSKTASRRQVDKPIAKTEGVAGVVGEGDGRLRSVRRAIRSRQYFSGSSLQSFVECLRAGVVGASLSRSSAALRAGLAWLRPGRWLIRD